jgi:hypothetical protein
MPPVRRQRRRKYRKAIVVGGIKNLIKILDDHNFKQQLAATADHLGMSKMQVLTQVLGR